MRTRQGRTRRRTVLVCGGCRRVYKTVLPAPSENGGAVPQYVRVGVCLRCRVDVREWIHAELGAGRKLDVT